MANCYNNSAVVGCYTNAAGVSTSVVIHYTYDANGNPGVHITDSSGTVIPGASLANTVPGACATPVATRTVNGGGLNLGSGTLAASYGLGGTTWSPPAAPAKLQAFTVTVLVADNVPNGANTVTVAFAKTGTTLHMVAGQSLTWSISQDNGLTADQLDPGITVTTNGNSAATVNWTQA